MKILRAYFDNVIASAITRRDLSPEERHAVDQILVFGKEGKIDIASSRWSLREMERTRDPRVREELRRGFSSLGVVQDDHIVLGFDNQYGQNGGCSNPLVTDVIDESVLAALIQAGLRGMDARHFMIACCNEFDRFITTDPDFFDRRIQIEALFPSTKIRKPSELAEELNGTVKLANSCLRGD